MLILQRDAEAVSGAEGAPGWAWAVFVGTVVVALALDLARHDPEEGISRRQAVVWSVVWVGLGLAFLPFVGAVEGGRAAREYLAVYLLEKSLSLDNLFLFFVIFRALDVPRRHHHRVLFWGILGAVAFRGVFIFVGVAAIRAFDWVTYVFGGILLVAAWRSLRADPAYDGGGRLARWLSRHLPVASEGQGVRFVVREDGRLVATTSLLALAAVELSDVLFAIDSVAAALSVTRDEFVLYSANIFAVLGLRALYLLLEDVIGRFRYLHFGLAAVLAFAGLKIVAHGWVEVPPLVSVAVIVACVGTSIWASLGGSGEADLTAGPE